jgi:SAM-dependent methyltransferase
MTGRSRTEPFVIHHRRYDEWFERHRAAYLSELLAVRAVLPWQGRGLEIGVGSARFAGPLGVKFGIDPAVEMLAYARARGVSVACAVAEALPFDDGVFDYVLIVTTICFVDNPVRMLAEARRVLRPQGALCIGFIDRDTPLGRFYQAHRNENVFYRDAVFYNSAEVEGLLKETGFCETGWTQTLFGRLEEMTEINPVRPGRGEGGFAVVRATA